ncbi:hypothetical protein [Micromonospora sp. CPCC 206061]|uniref:hypothetical protein n=1 Tax=Micromonospora sp. CPCC 206061 TaxID=3122410 RepID=UPI002FF1D433
MATVDRAKNQARALFGGASGDGVVTFQNAGMFGATAHVDTGGGSGRAAFDGTTYISDRYTEPLRSRYAPIIDRIGVTPYSR